MSETVLTYKPQLRVFENATELEKACRETLEEARARMRLLESGPDDSLLDAWDDVEILVEDIFSPVSLQSEVHPDEELRKTADDRLVELTSFHTEIFQNEKLYAAVSAVEPGTPAEAKLKADLLEDFEDSGVHLPEADRERVREIVTEIAELSQEFSRNVRETSEKVAFSESEIEGLPESLKERIERDGETFLVGLDYPEYHPFMMNVKSEDARRKLFLAYHRRGGERNLEILSRVTALRAEMAGLYGFESFAEMIIRRKMAGSPARVEQMLETVREAVEERERTDLETLLEEKRALGGEGPVERWDVAFLLERIRERRFAVDQEELRKYFPTEPVTDWILELCSRLYGLRFERAEPEVWHEEVEAYDVLDRDSEEFLGSIYLDLFPREGKYKHAAAWPIRGVSRRVGRTPISVLVTNFDRTGLTQNEVETYLHEFGHVLHGVLSNTWFNRHAGTSVERDFVEAPSQMFEEWARREEALGILAEVSPESPAINADLVKRLDAARRFGRGIHYARQHLYASFDMVLSTDGGNDVLDVWRRMESTTPLGYTDQTMFPASFGHLTGGYAAGYYGYLWSEAIAKDMLSAFGEDLMDPVVGRRFRDDVLGQGSEKKGEQIVEGFLGRPSNSEAFAADLRGEERG